MKPKKAGKDYFYIFPDAKLNISLDFPSRCSKIIKSSEIKDAILNIFDIDIGPSWFKIEHSILTSKVVLLIFDGVDQTRYVKYKSSFPNFSKISEQGVYPCIVNAVNIDYKITPGIFTAIGYDSSKKVKKSYQNLEEMMMTTRDLADNGFPSTEANDFAIKKCRYEYFKLPKLTEEDYKSYRCLPDEAPKFHEFIGIDCEMIETTSGPELARLSLVDIDGNLLVDEYFKPENEIVDYKTKFSGITEEKLSNITRGSRESFDILSQFASKNTYFIGHSLENDFRVLKLIHNKVIDTSIIYNGDSRYPRKPSLYDLYTKYIGNSFRSEDGTHDSVEDAKAALALVKYGLKNPVTAVFKEPSAPELFEKLNNVGLKCSFVSRKKRYQRLESVLKTENIKYIQEDDDPSICKAVVKNIGDYDFICAQFTEFNDMQPSDTSFQEVARRYDRYLDDVLNAIPPCSIVFIYCPNGNPHLYSKPGARVFDYNEFSNCVNGLLWIYLREK